jgi:7-carboxy-7-deazaguanine synthase
MHRLRITEIFYSLQGETKTVGLPTVFVRLTGCPLRCQYCDTAYAFQGGNWRDMEEIIAEVKKYSAKHVTVTGGEPLAQKASYELLKRLCDEGFEVSLETSGAMCVEMVDVRVVKVVDIKTPDSRESERNLWSNLDHLLPHDQVKFVICSEADYVWSRDILRQHKINEHCEVLFSPSFNQLQPGQLADWVLRDQLPVRLQIQLHKVLWGDVPGR